MSEHGHTLNQQDEDTVPEFRISFRVLGQQLDFKKISTEFGISPSRTHRTGEVDILGSRFDRDMWILESPLGREAEFNQHFEWLKQTFGNRLASLRESVRDVDLSIVCNYRTYDSDQGGFILTPASLSVCNELGVRVEFHLLFI